ncbi:MAG: M15 family metallopeptidase [Clostridiales bacterium]|nr:M15 family metallopeptidase [Candidatus Equinaster intestinalis]
MSKRVRVNYKRFFTVIICFLLLIAIIVFAVITIKNKSGDNNADSGESSSQVLSDVSSSEAEIPYEERVGKKYQIDIEPYLQYIEPETDEYLFLVNPTHTLAADYVPEDLTDCGITRQDGRATQKLRLYAAKALEAMMKEGALNGVNDVTATSAYRSYSYQDQLFNQYCAQHQHKFKTREECEAYVLTFSTKPGTSEHQSGLCLDMHNIPSAEQYFAEKPEAKWLAENCYRFGFILRYPEDKEDITKIIYEPWHFRYVGRRFATEMHEKNMCLEEYLDYLGK